MTNVKRAKALLRDTAERKALRRDVDKKKSSNVRGRNMSGFYELPLKGKRLPSQAEWERDRIQFESMPVGIKDLQSSIGPLDDLFRPPLYTHISDEIVRLRTLGTSWVHVESALREKFVTTAKAASDLKSRIMLVQDTVKEFKLAEKTKLATYEVPKEEL